MNDLIGTHAMYFDNWTLTLIYMYFFDGQTRIHLHKHISQQYHKPIVHHLQGLLPENKKTEKFRQLKIFSIYR